VYVENFCLNLQKASLKNVEYKKLCFTLDQVSISSTFYIQIFRTNIVLAAFSSCIDTDDWTVFFTLLQKLYVERWWNWHQMWGNDLLGDDEPTCWSTKYGAKVWHFELGQKKSCAITKMIKERQSFNFNNVLHAAFACIDPKSAQITVKPSAILRFWDLRA